MIINCSRLASALAAGFVLLSLGNSVRAQESNIASPELLPEEARDYLLDGPWIYKANRRSIALQVADFNGDGLNDIATIANEKSLLELFIQQEGADWNRETFEKEEISLDRIVRSAAAADVDGDGRIDMVLATSPPRLAVMYQSDKGLLQPPTETDLEADGVTTGDLNGDGRDDIMVLREGRFDLLMAGARGVDLEPAQTFYTTGEPVGAPMIFDFDGDGRNDIVYHDSKDYENLVVRLQSGDGTFPAEFSVSSGVMRSVAALPADRGPGSVIAVQNKTRQLVQLQLAEPSEAEIESQQLPVSEIQTIAFDPEKRSSKSRATVADFDGDGRSDVLVYAKDLSIMRLLRQTRSGSLTGTTVPSLSGLQNVQSVAAAKGKSSPLILFSPEEKAIGYTRMGAKGGTLPFPRVLPISGEPKAVAIFPYEKSSHIAAVVLPSDGSRSPKLLGWSISEDGKLGEQRELLSSSGKSPLDGLDIIGMETMDFNRDERADLVIYVDFKPAKIFLQSEDGTFEELTATSGVLEGLLASSRPGSLMEARLGGRKGKVSILAQTENFVRAFFIDEDKNVVVEQQFNTRNSRARLTAMAVGNLRGEDRPEVLLLDRGNRIITVYGEVDDQWEVLRHIELDGADYGAVKVFDLDGDGKEDILLTSDDRVSVIYTHPIHGGLQTIASISSPVEEGGYGKVYTTQLIAGGPMEVVSVEMRDNLLEMFVTGTDEEKRDALLRFYSFKVFDSDSTVARRVNLDSPPEPREVIAEDLNGDGMNEVITLTHDNVIMYYPQEAKDTNKGG